VLGRQGNRALRDHNPDFGSANLHWDLPPRSQVPSRGVAAKPRSLFTYYSSTEALNGMRLADDLAVGIEARTRAIYGIRPPKGAGSEK
jgi:hypothetical protein